ncbi:hypothetical protein GCM10029963_53290 [Micromonospora andamanensis]
MGGGLIGRTVATGGRRASTGPTSGLATPEKWVEEWFAGGSSTAAGVWVSEETALHYSPFFAGVNVISTDVAMLPHLVYERLDRGKRRAREHPVYRVLHEEPNPVMPPIALRRTAQAHALTWGTGYANVVWDNRGNVVELWPLRPDRITPEIKRTGPGRLTVTYRYVDDVNGIRTRLFPDEVLPIGGLGYDGIRGYSVVAMARQSIGLGMALERYGSALFGNGARPGGVLKHPKKLSPDGHKRLQADWDNLHRGSTARSASRSSRKGWSGSRSASHPRTPSSWRPASCRSTRWPGGCACLHTRSATWSGRRTTTSSTRAWSTWPRPSWAG